MYDACLLKPENEVARLIALHELGLLGGEQLPELDRLTALAADVCSADLASVTLFAEHEGTQISVSHGQCASFDRGDTICAYMIAEGRTLVVADAARESRYARMRYVAGEPHVRSYVSMPVGADPALSVGSLCLIGFQPNMFGDQELRRLQRIADLVRHFLEARLAKLRADRAAAKTSEERQRQHLFELIFEAIQEGVNVYSLDGRIVESNPAAMRFLNLTRDEQIGRITGDPRWKILRPDGSAMPREEFPIIRALASGETMRDERIGVEMPGGERRWISVNTGPVHDPETGAITHLTMTFAEITAQREAELQLGEQNTQLAEALAEAEKASRAKTDFMGVVSHELRTPMNAVLSCALLLSQSKLDPVQKRTLGVLEDAGRQMLALLNDLLDLSSLNAGKVRIEREPVSLVRLIEDAAVIWAADIRAKGLSLSVMIDPELVAPRNVDPARLLQIIGNLLGNAIKFTSAGGITIQAWPQTVKGGAESVAIEVEDTGPGVSPEAAERIFSPFEQADVSSKRRHGGLGLGLYVARRLAVAMGGDIELDSRPDMGSRFIVHIAAPLSQRPAPSRTARIPANDEDFQARDVLCIDDNPRNLYVLGAILRAAGHRTTEVVSGAEALEKLASRKFDVIMLDMVMPDMDGLDVLANLRAMGGVNRETPVIACTANVLPDQVETYRRAGTVGVLAKPIDIRAMLEAVAAAAA